jgi:hypothetical protein
MLAQHRDQLRLAPNRLLADDFRERRAPLEVSVSPLNIGVSVAGLA